MPFMEVASGMDIRDLAGWALLVLQGVAASGGTVHVLLRKDHARSAVGWIGMLWLVPLLGGLLYLLFGINRVKRKAYRLRGRRVPAGAQAPIPPEAAADAHSPVGDLARFIGRVSRTPLLAGNDLVLLRHGDEAYPAMLGDIREARHTITLGTFMFEDDRCGGRFVAALGEAAERGVEVRVLIDGMGCRSPLNPVPRRLAARGVQVALFLWSFWPWRMAYLNLRNHRKLLVVDGRIAYTGGLNICQKHVLADHPKDPAGSLHARLMGPVVAQLQAAFAEDWQFTTGEALRGEAWFPPLRSCGRVLARALPDGPDIEQDVTNWAYLGGLACAQRRVLVLTPYFLPEEDLLRALATAALRGVEVDVVLQQDTDVPFLNWASMAELHHIVRYGCRVWLSPGPFDHSKLLVVDDRWALLGSPNWDERSLRLNFELSVECHDEALASACAAHIEGQMQGARRVTLETLQARSLPVRVRDGAIRLFKPYL